MILQGKVAANAENIESRLTNGINMVELQLLKGDTHGSVLKVLTDYPDLQVTVVHPVIGGDQDKCTVNLNHLSYRPVFDNFISACIVADFMGKIQKRKVGVVIHNTASAHEYQCAPALWESVVNILSKTQDIYKNVYFLIENVTPFSSCIGLSNGTLSKDLGWIVKQLQNQYINAWINLDLCHNQMTYQFFKKQYDETEIGKLSDADLDKFTLEYWFRNYGYLIKNVHIAKCIGDGVIKGHHGAPLDKSDIAMLDKLKTLSNVYAEDDILWTIEVQDDDYVAIPNQLSTLRLLQKELMLVIGKNDC